MKKKRQAVAALALCMMCVAAGCGNASESASVSNKADSVASSDAGSLSHSESGDASGDLKVTVLPAVVVDYVTASGDALDSPKTSLFPKENDDNWTKNITPSESETGMEYIPPGYFSEKCDEPGTLVSIEYETPILDFGDGSDDERRLAKGTPTGETSHKEAMVYLPYGYSEDQKYDIMYLQHGMSGTPHTYLGNEDNDGAFKTMIDHMIKDGVIKPIIIVAPTITPEYETEIDRVNGLSCEVRDTLIPIIESKYSTYAESVSEKDLIKSREHRCFGGFSMGGCATWWMLWKNTDYFRYYIPNSMIINPEEGTPVIEKPTEQMAEEMSLAGFTKDDFLIYCGTGTRDYTDYAVEQQVEELLKYPELFVSTGESGFDDGNLMFRVWGGHYHKYTESFDYFFNALKLFFSK